VVGSIMPGGDWEEKVGEAVGLCVDAVLVRVHGPGLS
jgi:hypothetical protein